jgi:hypothetical protein
MEFVGIISKLLVFTELLDLIVVCEVFWFLYIDWGLSTTAFWAKIIPFPRLGEF